METDPQLAPSVVSVMVVHQPGDWFDETLDALASQDYPNLRTLFLLTPTADEQRAALTERIRSVLPSAFVRSLPANAGFGPSASEVLRLVEGDNGFFLLCHDDIAPAHDAVRLMVAELFRSNAGIVGPKLTEWEQPRVLQHVGLGLDRFGEVDPLVDPGEVDQEQHDAVRDVFVLPSACLLVRADLFRALGGFDPAIDYHGDDVELCWRAHLTGARVIVVPDARVRHRERLRERRPDLPHRALASRHRMRAVATLTGGSRLVGRSIQMVLVTLVELVVGLFTGRFGEALASLRALIGLLPRTGAIVARRRAIRGQRVVPEREVLGLQIRGSSRLSSYLRGKETATFVGAESTVRRWREATFGPTLAWFLVVLGVLIGSRSFITDSVPPVGEFLPFPESPRDLFADYRSSFDHRGFGATVATPLGWGVIAVSSVLAAFHMSLLMTMSVVGCYLLGAIGAWRLATVFPVNRARIAGMVVYVGTPLVPGLMSHGEWSALAWYAALPWLVHLLRRVAGLETADPDAVETDLTDGVRAVGLRYRARAFAFLSLVLATAAAFAPVVVVLWTVVGGLLAIGTLLALSSWRVALWFVGGTLASGMTALVLNLPWSLDWSWADMAGASGPGATGRGMAEILTLSPSSDGFAVLAIALYLPLLAAIAISRAWRFTWSVRAAMLVFFFGTLMVLGEHDVVGFALPSSAMLAIPVALGLALAAAAITGGFGTDVLGRGFGWRQPFALVANVGIVVGLVPAVLSIGDGAWKTDDTPLPTLLAAQLPEDPSAGDYRVLYLGDDRVLPVPGREYREGIAYAVVDAGELDFTDRFTLPHTDGDDAVERALTLIADGSTLRAGQLLAPLGIRFIVVPITDGVASTTDDPIAPPEGLLAALQNQLDIGEVYGPPSLEIYVNQAWIPVGAQLTGATAEASNLAGEDALVRADLGEAVPSMIGIDGSTEAVNEVAPGVVHLAIPFDDRFTLEVGGRAVAARPGFGVTTAFDVADGGTGRIDYEADPTRRWWLFSQGAAWFVVVVIATGARSPFGRRRGPAIHDETLIDLSDAPPIGIAGEALGTPAWDEAMDADESEYPEAPPATPPSERGSQTRPVVRDTTPPSGLPLVDHGATGDASAVPDDDEVDLAALVASVEPDGSDERGEEVPEERTDPDDSALGEEES